ncbi:MAG: GGDEF domain-containing protein [Desulfobacterales bacterium]|nr:GGDEF domain-containing protein [Desulfobacterales bacterium]
MLLKFKSDRDRKMSNFNEIMEFLENLGDAIIIVNESSEIIFANSSCAKMFGYKARAMSGMLIDNLMRPSNNIDHREMVKKFIQSKSPARTMMTRGVLPCVDKYGNIFNARISIASATIDQRMYGVATIQDFTSLQKEIENLEITTYQDTLTGLYNRRYLQTITESNSRILHTWKTIGLIYIDLDKFKPINDKHGHGVGDAVLKAVSNRINGGIRFDDIAFRLGGDEFLILLNLTHAMDKTGLINRITEKIYREVTRPIEIGQIVIKVGFSAGCGIYPEDESDFMRLVDMADKAMYSAKGTETSIANVWVKPNKINEH